MPHTLEVNPHALTFLVRDPRLFKVAAIIAKDMGIGQLFRDRHRLIVQCANVDDLALLLGMLGDRMD